MLDRRLRKTSQRLLAPLAEPLGLVGPLPITIIGLAFGLASAGAASQGWWMVALAAWLLNRIFDGLDGIVARAAGRASDAGAYLDMTFDVAVYAVVPLGVAVGLGSSRAWTAAAVLLASFYFNTITWSYLSALFEKQGRGAGASGETTSVTMPAGLIEGTETIVFFAVLFVVARYSNVWAEALMFSMAGLVLVGALIRFGQGRAALLEVD